MTAGLMVAFGDGIFIDPAAVTAVVETPEHTSAVHLLGGGELTVPSPAAETVRRLDQGYA